MPGDEDRVSALSVFKELQKHLQESAVAHTQMANDIKRAQELAQEAEERSAQAFDLVRALDGFTEVQRTRLILIADESVKDEQARTDFQRQFIIAVFGLLASGLLGAFVWPILKALAGG